MIRNRVQACGVIVASALDDLWIQSTFQSDGIGCCLKCCARCDALRFLDKEGILDELARNWDTYEEGETLEEGSPSWWSNGKVDREWMYEQWKEGRCPNHEQST